ncbi:MAG: hypothetical protein NVSMB34_11940 [Variovorax sp.]
MGNPAKGWSPERRQRQREAIQRWKPWSKSTGPKSAEGKAAVARNAYMGGPELRLRELMKMAHAALRRQRDFLR